MSRLFIPLSEPNLKGNELKYVTDAIKTEWVSTGGAYITEFERNISDYLKVQDAVAVQSGTAGLHLALKEAGVGQGDLVIVPTLTFIAAVNPIKYLGAEPVFMDCDDTLCMDINKVEKFIEAQCKMVAGELYHIESKQIIRAVVVVHVFGNLADMEHLLKLSNRYNIAIIEDATEALGTFDLDGRAAGNFGQFGVFSFNGNKIITTGGGGMVVSKDNIKLSHIKYLSTQAKDDALNYVHNEIGYNYRMTNVQAAIGVAQLEMLENFIKVKQDNYNYYKQVLKDVDNLKILNFRPDIRPNYWFYSIQLMGYDIDEVISQLQKYKIQTRPIWRLIHEQLPYRHNIKFEIEKAPIYANSVINVPCSSNLTKLNIDYVCEKLIEILRTAK
ncbi:MAG: aminotransferase DegT [Epulopiscium sp. Nuni2H_MBin003]|nr:MAG: aminotransferase DegT [Epulopiscium sp. Nuni2H_MBin003]